MSIFSECFEGVICGGPPPPDGWDARVTSRPRRATGPLHGATAGALHEKATNPEPPTISRISLQLGCLLLLDCALASRDDTRPPRNPRMLGEPTVRSPPAGPIPTRPTEPRSLLCIHIFGSGGEPRHILPQRRISNLLPAPKKERTGRHWNWARCAIPVPSRGAGQDRPQVYLGRRQAGGPAQNPGSWESSMARSPKPGPQDGRDSWCAEACSHTGGHWAEAPLLRRSVATLARRSAPGARRQRRLYPGRLIRQSS